MSENVEQHGFAVIDCDSMRVLATAENFVTAVHLAQMSMNNTHKERTVYKLVSRVVNKFREESEA